MVSLQSLKIYGPAKRELLLKCFFLGLELGSVLVLVL